MEMEMFLGLIHHFSLCVNVIKGKILIIITLNCYLTIRITLILYVWLISYILVYIPLQLFNLPRTLSSAKSGYVYMLAPPRSARK